MNACDKLGPSDSRLRLDINYAFMLAGLRKLSTDGYYEMHIEGLNIPVFLFNFRAYVNQGINAVHN